MSDRKAGMKPRSRKKEVSTALYAFDRELVDSGHRCFVGIDEAGRGSFAGPVVAAAVILDLADPIPGINDSKQLTEEAREELYGQITTRAVCFAAGSAGPDEIDRVNILQATFLAMRRALDAIAVPWSIAIIDGNQPLPGLDGERQRTVVKGDAKSASIAAASIIAKVTRDRFMKECHGRFPIYDFLTNKGYGTAAHRASIQEHGLCELHRRSFCENLFTQTRLEL